VRARGSFFCTVLFFRGGPRLLCEIFGIGAASLCRKQERKQVETPNEVQELVTRGGARETPEEVR
jgi:hypothetical protein